MGHMCCALFLSIHCNEIPNVEIKCPPQLVYNRIRTTQYTVYLASKKRAPYVRSKKHTTTAWFYTSMSFLEIKTPQELADGQQYQLRIVTTILTHEIHRSKRQWHNTNNNNCLFYSDHSCLGISGRFTE